MKCTDIENLLDSQALKEWPGEQLARAHAHAESCEKCQALLSAELDMQDSLAGLEEPAVPENLAASVMARIEESEKSFAKEAIPMALGGTTAWSIIMLVAGFTITLGLYSYKLFQGQSTLFNIFSLWNGEWSQWVMTPLQFNQVGLGLACGFICYAMGFLLMLEQKEDNY